MQRPRPRAGPAAGLARRPGRDGAVADQLATGALTARGADRVLRVAWTLADLAGLDRPGLAQVQTAGALRGASAVRS